MINDERLFPPDADTPFPKSFESQVSQIFRRLLRVFVHVYYHHFDKMTQIGAVRLACGEGGGGEVGTKLRCPPAVCTPTSPLHTLRRHRRHCHSGVHGPCNAPRANRVVGCFCWLGNRRSPATKQEAHINTCYKHFYYFVKEFGLIQSKEMEPLVSLLARNPNTLRTVARRKRSAGVRVFGSSVLLWCGAPSLACKPSCLCCHTPPCMCAEGPHKIAVQGGIA